MGGETKLEMAIRHVVEGNRIVHKQLDLIERLRIAGLPMFEAERTLSLFESTLKIFKEHAQQFAQEESAPYPQPPRPGAIPRASKQRLSRRAPRREVGRSGTPSR
jgi:hypothetical protein